jgi:hypothetical protein
VFYLSLNQSCQQTVDKKDGPDPARSLSGFLFDLFCGLMQCQDEKLVLLQTYAAELCSQTALWSPRDLDRTKGSH